MPLVALTLSACSDPGNQTANNPTPNNHNKPNTVNPAQTVKAQGAQRDNHPFAAAMKAVEQGASGRLPKASGSQASAEQEPTLAPGQRITPPKGAEPYLEDLEKFVDVNVKPERLKRATPKTPSELSKAPQKPKAELSLGFSSLNCQPAPGIDERLLKAVTQPSIYYYTYGFIYLDEYLSP